MTVNPKETAPKTGQIILAIKKMYAYIPDEPAGTKHEISSNCPVGQIYWDNGWFVEYDGKPFDRGWTHWMPLVRETKVKSKRIRA